MRDCGICKMCGMSKNKMIVDHIVELKDGGEAFDYNNLETLCVSCHNKKTTEEIQRRNND